MDIAKIIVERRETQKLSQRALAQKAGIRQATLSSVERGGDVRWTTALSILFALGLDFDVVPVRTSSREAAKRQSMERQQEIRRVQAHVQKRRRELQVLLGKVSAQQIGDVRAMNRKTNTGYLAELWEEFLRLDHLAMHRMLDAEQFKGMAWQSLLQANPFIVAGVGSWR